MSYNLNNKKVLITGSSGGIGKALCKKFIENDCIINLYCIRITIS